MTPEDGGVDREELASFLATAPEHLKGWAGEQLAQLEGAESDGAGKAGPAGAGGRRGSKRPGGDKGDDGGQKPVDDERAADVEDILEEDDEEPAQRAPGPRRTAGAGRRSCSRRPGSPG